MVKTLTYFFIGALTGLLLLLITAFFAFESKFQNKAYPNVQIENLDLGGKTEDEVKAVLEQKNSQFANLQFTFIFEKKIATISAKDLKVGYNTGLLTKQVMLIGRSGNIFSRLIQQFSQNRLLPSFSYDKFALDNFLSFFSSDFDTVPVEPLFKFENNRVIAFRQAQAGKVIDKETAKKDFSEIISPPKSTVIILKVKTLEPKFKTAEVNKFGIKDFLGSGKSFFRGSISGRIFNIALAASRINGILISPGETFSFNKSVGEISAATGYQPAYIIKERKTILDDGGGVCQVSTTVFRAALAAGLPIIERTAHAYRVSYYEQGSFGPGLDATVYDPTVDLKIKNDTPAYILIQTIFDADSSSLTISFYGTSDGRTATISKPKILSETPSLPDVYQDDPTLPKGQIKQVDFPASGAKTSFDYKVIRDKEILQSRVFYSNFQPWQAVFLRGTKE